MNAMVGIIKCQERARNECLCCHHRKETRPMLRIRLVGNIRARGLDVSRLLALVANLLAT